MSEPRVFVCGGGGGVGKTTTSAALATAFARSGKRTLIMTVDPARRLADAMGIQLGSTPQHVTHDPSLGDRLDALMPEPGRSSQLFFEYLFQDRPDVLQRMLKNRFYKAIEDSVAGVHELVSLMLLVRAVDERSYDVVVVDTAPSRYALDFVTYPGRLAALLESRAMSFFSNLAVRSREDEASSGGILDWGRRRVESLITKVLDAGMLHDLTGFFADLLLVRERFARVARTSEQLLLGTHTHYVLVAAPTGAARGDLRYLELKLAKMGRPVDAVVLNRADTQRAGWSEALSAEPDLADPLKEALQQLGSEQQARKAAADEMERELTKRHPKLPQVRLPQIQALRPTDIVDALARELERYLGVLLRMA